MKCYMCPYYVQGMLENECKVTGDYCFHTVDDCDLVNDDGTINEEKVKEI